MTQQINLLLVYDNLQLGGIQTLILRMCKYFHRKGINTVLLLNKGGELLDDVKKYSTVIIDKRRKNTFKDCPSDLDKINITYIYSFDLYSIVKSTWLCSKKFRNAKLVTGVYFPKEYCSEATKQRYIQKLVKNILKLIPISNIFFMNETNASSLGACINRNYKNSPIIPLPIDIKSSGITDSPIKRNKIISIGRITAFKTYNFHMVDVVIELNNQGFDIQYHIYGWGELEHKLHEYIDKKDASKYVIFHGPISYENVNNVMSEAYLFVGMGTAMLEAASTGLPSLVAIESSDEPITYGFFHERGSEIYNVGEYDTQLNTYKLIDQVKYLYSLSDSEYNDIKKETYNSVNRFSTDIVMERYLDALKVTKSFSYKIPKFVKLYLFADLWKWRILKRLGYIDPLVARYSANN